MTERVDAEGFAECASCAAKPGSPELCKACYQNRTTIHRLSRALAAAPEASRQRSDDVLCVVIGGCVVGEFVGYNVAHVEDALDDEDGRTTLHLDVYVDHRDLATFMAHLAARYEGR